jgi:hypothetical protein
MLEMTEPQYILIRADGTRIPIPAQGLALGRSSQNDVVLKDTNISRRHARILLAAGRCWIRDEGSALGTLLNGQLVPGQTEFKPGDTLHLGPQAFTLEKQEAPEPTPLEPEPSTPRRVKPAVAIGLGVGLVAILVAVAFATGLIGGRTSSAGYTRYQDPYNVYSIDIPETWVAEEGYDFAVYTTFFRDPDWEDEERGVIITGAPLSDADLEFGVDVQAPEDMFIYATDFDMDELEELYPDVELRNVTLGGDPAIILEMTITENGITYNAQLASVLSEEAFAIFMAAFPQGEWEANQSVIDHMLDSLRLE